MALNGNPFNPMKVRRACRKESPISSCGAFIVLSVDTGRTKPKGAVDKPNGSVKATYRPSKAVDDTKRGSSYGQAK